MTAKKKLTKTLVDKLEVNADQPYFVWDSALTGFAVKVLPTGRKVFVFQGRLMRKAVKITIGKYGALTLEEARKKAKQHAADLSNNIDPRTQSAPDEVDAAFGDMLSAYVETLYAAKKYSAKSVESALQKNVALAFPKLWNKAAKLIDLDDCVKIIGKLVSEQKLRQADKVRSYIRSAFAEAIQAKGNANAPERLRDMKITFNPARDLSKVEGSSNTNDRVLEKSEFIAYWEHIKALPEPSRSIAMLHVLTGGQRQAQLSRVTLDDIDLTSQTLVIYDPKGRRKQHRRHVVPLIPEAMQSIKTLTQYGGFVFSDTGGISAVNDDYLNKKVVRPIIEKMEKEGQLLKGSFTAGCIRSSIETRLADRPYRISSDVLGQLLSHGTGGVQNRHYQRYDYFEDKLEALQMLYRMLEQQPEPSAQVIQWRSA